MSKFYYLKKVEDHKYGFVYTKDFETDADNYYVQVTNMRKKEELLRRLSEYKK